MLLYDWIERIKGPSILFILYSFSFFTLKLVFLTGNKAPNSTTILIQHIYIEIIMGSTPKKIPTAYTILEINKKKKIINVILTN